MNTSRRTKQILSAVLMIIILVANQACNGSGNEKNSVVSNPGMGDLRVFERQQSSQTTNSLAANQDYVGMGDLHVYEAQQSAYTTGTEAANRDYAGMGDLHVYERQSSSKTTSEQPYVGMGDLKVFEALQKDQETADAGYQTP